MKNKCVVITGATHGVGWAISQHLADLGAHVVGLASHTEDIDFPGHLYACDLADAGQTEEVLRMLREKYPVDAVVNYADLILPQPLGEVEIASLYRVFDLHVRVALQLTQIFTPSMQARQEGRIITITSPMAHGELGHTSYAAAMGALLSCTKTWAVELAPYNITVNTVAPSAEVLKLFTHEVAATVAFLLHETASHITGQELVINGH